MGGGGLLESMLQTPKTEIQSVATDAIFFNGFLIKQKSIDIDSATKPQTNFLHMWLYF